MFLIPYITMLFLIGMPMTFLEMSFGQFSSCSPTTIWSISPIFKGVGFAMVIICGIVCIYYNIIIAWTLYYLFRSFTTELPWATCGNAWNTPRCVLANNDNATLYGNTTGNVFTEQVVINGNDSNGYSYSGVRETTLSNSDSLLSNITGLLSNGSLLGNGSVLPRTSPSEEFWERHVLQLTSGIEEMGSIRWELLGCLALAWLIIFLCLIKGIKSSGRVVYVTAIFPYLVSLHITHHSKIEYYL